MKVSSLCYSLSGVEVPMLTITENKEEEEEKEGKEKPVKNKKEKKKQIVVITGRVHPGESCGS